MGTALPFALDYNGTLAREGQDFRLASSVVSLQAGQSEAAVLLLILDDSEPEGQEAFFVYLSDPEGGGQIADRTDHQGFGAFAKIVILGKMWICFLVVLYVCESSESLNPEVLEEKEGNVGNLSARSGTTIPHY